MQDISIFVLFKQSAFSVHKLSFVYRYQQFGNEFTRSKIEYNTIEAMKTYKKLVEAAVFCSSMEILLRECWSEIRCNRNCFIASKVFDSKASVHQKIVNIFSTRGKKERQKVLCPKGRQRKRVLFLRYSQHKINMLQFVCMKSIATDRIDRQIDLYYYNKTICMQNSHTKVISRRRTKTSQHHP